MGLSSKLVSEDMLEWGQNLMQPPKTTFPMKRQQQQQQSEPALKCPRCDSTNTKFCYYNNYNKTQPRHFCKACKRHWTKGGTLRNVPVGGIRKNKKIKTSNANLDEQVKNRLSTIQNQKFSLIDHDQKGVSDLFTQPLVCPSPYLDAINNNNNNNCVFLGSNISLPMHSFPFSSSGSFASNDTPSSILACFETSIGYDHHYNEGMNKDSTSNVIMEMPTSYWCGATANTTNWDDFDTFTSTDLNIPWYDSNVKPS